MADEPVIPRIDPRENFVAGTSFHGDTLNTTKAILQEKFGNPVSLDDTKVYFEWSLEYVKSSTETIPFYIYDWKEYSEPEDNTPIYWHIGAKNAQESEEVYNYINTLLETTSNNDGDNSEGNNESSETEQSIEE